jgi:drug/metabolite transporter (DMT)-like permease
MKNGGGRAQSLLEIHGAVVLFGLAGLFGKWLALSPLIIVLGRVVFASLALGLLILATGRSLRVAKPSDRLLFLCLGALLAVHWTVFFLSVQVSTVAVGLLSYSSFPVFTAFIEPAVFRKRLDGGWGPGLRPGVHFRRTRPYIETTGEWRAEGSSLDPFNVFFAGICLLGVFLIVPRFAWTDAVFRGVLYGLAAGLTFAVLSIVNRLLTARHDSVKIAFWQDSIAALVLLPFLFILRPSLTVKDMGLLLFLGVVCTAGSHTLFIDAMRRQTAQTASIISSLEPVYGIALAYLFLREIPAPRTLLGGAVILAAVIVISLRALRKPPGGTG